MREATIRVSDEFLDSLGIGEFVSLIRTADPKQITELQCRRPGCLLVVEVAEPISEGRLSSLETIEWWERIEGGEVVTYLCKLVVPALEEGFDPPHETDISEDPVAITDDGIDLRIIGAHDDISERITEYERSGVDVVLRSLGRYHGPEDPLGQLTERQREVLMTAFNLGYFAVPRDATTEDIAAKLELSPSTVREHLQRAQHNVLAEVLGTL